MTESEQLLAQQAAVGPHRIAQAEVARNIRDLPALPTIVLELIRTFDQPDVDVARLAETISHDQALAARTLRVANSSFYGLASKVKTINQAIMVLGFDTVRSLVAAGAIVHALPGGGAHLDLALFWRHSMATAVCARNIARRTRLNQDYAFLSGLLHDIGRLVLATRFPQQYAAAMAWRDQQDAWQVDAEQQVLGIDHQQVGLMLAETWKFPALIQRAIGNHHAPALDDLGDVPSIVHVANAIVHALDLGGEADALVPPVSGEAWASLRLDCEMLRAVFRETGEQYEEACSILSA
ncbi:HDOD domain-containing protein [Massilia sp. GCM10020059]|uniref:HDOD domain-containing protein n=1 Tax=Massilia agrisoli TaxID=2892444 RepID=A0ABS8ITQ8_9BURK|nr:HDOD domain-containing protein [Massilia agrisoli]MCC6071990.1 HDOD domain-containing protein [Massilia agrisoli]